MKEPIKTMQCCLFCQNWGGYENEIYNIKYCTKKDEITTRFSHCESYFKDNPMILKLTKYKDNQRVQGLLSHYMK